MSNLDRMIELASHGTSRAQGQAPAGRELKDVPVTEEPTQEAVGEFAEPLYTLQDELGLEDNILVDELARWMSGQDIAEFVDDFRRNNDMDADQTEESVTNEATGVCKDCGCEIDNCKPGCDCPHDSHDAAGDHWVAEAKAKPDFADIDGDGDKDEDMKKAAKEKEETTVEENLEKAQEEIDELKEELDESPTMDTTQLINLMKNSGLSEEKIKTKLDEWANTPDGAAEEEATSHGEPYENFAQSVNLSLKRYLDAEDMKVGLKEHKVEDIKEAYKKSKGEK